MKLIPMSPLSLLLTAVVAAAVVAAVPDVTIPVEPIYNTGGNQCYDERNKPQVGLALRLFGIEITRRISYYYYYYYDYVM